MVFPEQNTSVEFTGWELLSEEADAELQLNRLLPRLEGGRVYWKCTAAVALTKRRPWRTDSRGGVSGIVAQPD
jgi:hypothetical protein